VKLNLKDIIEIPGGSVPFSQEIETDRLDFPSVLAYTAPITAEGEVRNTAGILELTGKLNASMHCVCDRCGTEFDRSKQIDLHATVTADPEADDDPEIFPLEGDWLDLDEVLTTLFILDMDTKFLCKEDCAAVYLTSPDYLGDTADLPAISAVCRRHGALLLVDNAHGAYLRFLSPSRHPLDLGADLCCDSAHKTLPALTGAAYLHFAAPVPSLAARAEAAMQLFASTSPSYLILQSLDACNALLAGDYPARIRETAARVDALKARLPFPQRGDEPLKLCLCPKARGWTGDALAARLGQQGIVCELADPDNRVFMCSPGNSEDDFRALEEALASVPAREPIRSAPPVPGLPEIVCAPREALFAPQEELPTARCLGRVLAAPTVSCPPAVPIVCCGERITERALALLRYYGIERCLVMKAH
jgi:arginine/lysine/ornithine decarboxylase